MDIHMCSEQSRKRVYPSESGICINPKEGNPPTYAVLEDKMFTIKDFDGNIIKEMRLG